MDIRLWEGVSTVMKRFLVQSSTSGFKGEEFFSEFSEAVRVIRIHLTTYASRSYQLLEWCVLYDLVTREKIRFTANTLGGVHEGCFEGQEVFR